MSGAWCSSWQNEEWNRRSEGRLAIFTLTTDVLSIHVDKHRAALDRRGIGLHRDHAGWRHDLPGFDVELAVVEVALDHVAVDEALRQRAGAVGAGVVGDVKLPVDIEDGDRHASRLDAERGSGGNLVGFAKFNSGRHRGGFSYEVDGSRIGVGFRPWVSAGGQPPLPWLAA